MGQSLGRDMISNFRYLKVHGAGEELVLCDRVNHTDHNRRKSDVAQ